MKEANKILAANLKIELHLQSPLPDRNSMDLILGIPSNAEKLEIRTQHSSCWRGLLDVSTYLKRENHLEKQLLTSDGGLTTWILIHQSDLLQPNKRPIYASCDTIKMRALVSSGDHNVKEVMTHAIANVFCKEE
jgi:hypothetical protein